MKKKSEKKTIRGKKCCSGSEADSVLVSHGEGKLSESELRHRSLPGCRNGTWLLPEPEK